jgi:predicted nucleotidyltransferase
MATAYDPAILMPSKPEIEKILAAKLSYEAAQVRPDRDTWNKKNFNLTPWGIAYNCSKAKYDKSVAAAKSKGAKVPNARADNTLRYFIIAVAIGWQELIDQLKRTIKNWGYTTAELQEMAKQVWQQPANAQLISTTVELVQAEGKIKLTEAIEKHDSLNSKLFTKDEMLKDKVHDKLLEIVDTFLADLEEQDVKIKVDDILLIGSNASYNYTKDSDIDLHIIANTKAVNYPAELGTVIYSAYRSLFNKSLDISIYDIPLEIFVETEESARVSNGVYSVKKNKWIKKPVQEAIPEYDKDALDKLVSEWEDKCKKLIADIKADKLDDEKKVVKMLEDIYEKLRKKGVAKGEYAIENLAFKELRNKGYLDRLKDYRNELTSKRLSLEEKLDRQIRLENYNQLTEAAGTQPIIQDNGMFFIYNLKASDIDNALNAIRRLPFVVEVQANENGKYDFSNTLELAMNKMPKKYYNIKGKLNF